MVKQSKRAVSAILSLAMFTTVLPPAALAAGDKTLVEGTAVYNEVLGTYEQQFQDSVRFTQDGKTNVTGTEWLADSETVGVNRERAHAQFVPYQDAQTGLAAEKSVLDAIGRDTSDYYRLLSGKNWDFALVRNPAEAAKKDAAYLAENYTGSGFTPEYVPQAWQTYRNADGTFKYFDEPMYTNHPFPWIGNFESTDYSNPSAPTQYNPVGYYRTTFNTPENWDGRETFLSFQSVESAYYVYVNGQCVGYSTDSFTAHDFDVTPYLKPAGQQNTLALKVFRWSIGSWLENQDFIRQSGIYRDVYLYSKGEAEIRDFFVKTSFKDRTSVDSDVDVTIETDVRGLSNAEARDYTVSAYLVNDAGATVATAADQTVNIAASSTKTPEQRLKDAGTTATTTFTVTNPDKWFSDTPNLYRLVLQLKKGNDVIETAVQRIGFREIYKTILDSSKNNEQIQITGEQLVLRGTNRHDTDLETGHALNFEDYKADLTLMKQMNINAIRTSHYPNDQSLYDLADELGIYVCSEANIESHRAAMNGINVPTGPSGSNGLAEWVPPVLDRTATMTERYKNHSSIVFWSLGNEATYSSPKLTNQYCFWVSSMYLLARDPSRIRKYEREGARGYNRPAGTDPWSVDARKNLMIDVSSAQYPTPSWSMGYNGQLPYVHSEYNHAMGQAYGNAKEHWDAIRAKDNVQGGFIWDWIDQSIQTTKDSNGDGVKETFWGYGGDWIDPVANDNAFCGNGLAYADRTPGPMTLEARKVHQQVNFYLTSENAVPNTAIDVQVVNEFENTPLSSFDITWKLTEDGTTELGKGTLDLSTAAMRGVHLTNAAEGGNAETFQITLPDFTPKAGSDYLLDFSVKYKEAKPWAEMGGELAYEQFQLSFKNPTPAASPAAAPDFTAVTEEGNTLTLTGTTDADQAFSIKLNTVTGELTEYALDGKTVMTAGPELSLWHPQTYNEAGYSTWSLPLQNAGNPLNMTNLIVDVDKSAANKVTLMTSGGLRVDADSAMTLEIYGNGEIVVAEQFVPKSNFAPQGLPKIGTRMVVSGDYGNFSWYGRGPWETYSDRKSGARIGTHESTVDEQYDMKMLKPQENGNHTDVRWTSLTNDQGTGLLVSAGNGNVVEVSALHNTAEEINSKTYNNADHRHPVDIQQRKDTVWSIDLRQDGVGDTGFSSPYPIAKYKIYTDKNYNYSYKISPISSESDKMSKSKELFTTPTAEYQVSSILVNGTPIPGFSPISRELTYEIPTDASNAVVTAVSTGDVSVTMNHNTGTATVTSISADDEVQTYTVHLVRAKQQLTGSTAFSAAVTNNSAGGNPAARLIDGNTGTFWDFNWGASNKWDMSQLYYAVELKVPTLISSLGYLPRQDAQTNGNFQGHEIYVSTKPISELHIGAGLVPDLTSKDWTMVASGVWDAGKAWKDDVFTVTEPVKTVLVQPTSTANSPAPPSDSYGCGAETRVSALRSAADATVTMEASYPLSGGAAEPDPNITVGGTKLIRGIDYTVAYENNKQAGEATATISYKGQFYGADVVKKFAVTQPAEGELVLGLTINGNKLDNFVYTTDTYEYALAFDTADVTVTANVAEGVHYTVEMSNSGAVVTATKDNLTKTYTITFTRASAEGSIGGTSTFARAQAHDTYSTSSTLNMFDGKTDTYWENSWSEQSVREAYVALELKNAMPLSAVQYLPRQDANQKNGRFLEYKIYGSEKPLSALIVNNYPTDFTGSDWLLAGEGTWASDITWKNAALNVQGKSVKTLLIQPVTTDGKTDSVKNKFGCVAEVTVTPSRSAADATVTMDATYPLVNGKAEPDPVITLGGVRLLRGADYTVAYSNNTEAGQTATATITYIGVFAGAPDVQKTFTVGNAATALSAPATIVWDTSIPTKATWSAVEHATGYSVQLFKDGVAVGSAISATGLEKNFAASILESGNYTFKVKAVGDGITYSDSVWSAASAANAHTASYMVRLTPGAGYTLEAATGSQTPVAEGGSFSFTLTVADSYNTSAPVVKANGVDLTADSQEGNVYTYTLSNILETKTITVSGIIKNTFIVSFVADEVTVDEKKVEYGGTLLRRNFPNVPAKTGYTGVWDQTTNITNVTDNVVVTAVYTGNTYDVTFDANGGSVVPETVEVTYGQPYGELPTPTHSDTDKAFDGWFTATDGGSSIKGTDLVQTADDHTLYAHWRDGATSETPETAISGMPEKVTLPYTGEGIILTAPTAPDGSTYTYQWKHMTDDENWETLEGETESTYTIPASDILYANSGWKFLCAVTNTQGELKPNTAESQPVTLTVQKGFRSAPEGLKGQAPTGADAADGKITGLTASETYEYKPEAAQTYNAVSANATEIIDLTAGVYLVRRVEDDNYLPSADAEVAVPTYNLDTAPIDTAIAAAKSAKSDVTVSDKAPDQVSKGTKFVTQTVMDSLNAAIAAATTAKETAVNQADVTAAVSALNTVVESFTAAIQVGTRKSSSSSSSSSSTPTTTTKTEKNADGSTTTTVTDLKTGNMTATTTYPSGTKIVTEMPKNGDIVSKITVPTGKTDMITLPADRLTAGTVAVIVRADGTREIIKTSVLTKDGIKFLAKENVTVKLVNNSKTFSDVPQSHWAAEYVQFATSRELFNGTGANTFSPETDMSRAMLVTVLARLDGQDVTGGAEWYSKAADWAKAKGISDGTDLQSNITREALAVMLYRYAGKPTAKQMEKTFSDSESISAWATDAISWCVNTGILNGKNGNLLDPQGSATRAEVAAMLMRFVRNSVNG